MALIMTMQLVNQGSLVHSARQHRGYRLLTKRKHNASIRAHHSAGCVCLTLLLCGRAEMWDQLFGHVDKKAHMKAMFELTTRMNSLARIVVGPANISATTALQVTCALCVLVNKVAATKDGSVHVFCLEWDRLAAHGAMHLRRSARQHDLLLAAAC